MAKKYIVFKANKQGTLDKIGVSNIKTMKRKFPKIRRLQR